MSKARKYTYNYAVIDEVISELWGEMTMAEIAKVLNEYPNRIAYRVKVLKDLGVIEGKYNMERGKLMRMRKESLSPGLDDVDSQLEKDRLICYTYCSHPSLGYFAMLLTSCDHVHCRL